MKHTIFLLLLLGTFTGSRAQNGFRKVYGSSVADNFSASVVNPVDSSIYAIGYTYAGGSPWLTGSSDTYLVKLNSSGDTLWSRIFGNSYNDFPDGIIMTSDGNLLVVGHYIEYIGNNDIYVMKLNLNGGVIWQRHYGDGSVGTLDSGTRSILEASNGDLYIFTKVRVSGNINTVLITKFTAAGAFVWQKYLNGSDDISLGKAILYNDSTIYLCGSTKTGAFLQQDDVYLMKIDTSANLLWEKIIKSNGYDFGYWVSKTANGDLLFTYNVNEQPAISRYDNAGNELMTRGYNPSTFLPVDFFMAEETANGNIAISGRRDIGTSYYVPLAMMVDASGTPLWGKMYSFSIYNEAYDCSFQAGHFYLAGGLVPGHFGSYDQLMIKADQSGAITGCGEDLFSDLSMVTPTYNSGAGVLTIGTATGVNVGNAPNLFTYVAYHAFPYINYDYMNTAVSGNTIVCSGDAVNLSVPPGNTYEWSTGATTSSISHVFPSSTTAWVVVSNQVCSDTSFVNITVNICTNIDQPKNGDELVVYPNPSNGIFSVSGIAPGAVLSIYNTLGERVFMQIAAADKTSIDLEAFADGIYFLQVRSGNSCITKKIIKEN